MNKLNLIVHTKHLKLIDFRKLCFLLLVLQLKFFACEAAAKQISCEKVASYEYADDIGNQKACVMKKKTIIDSLGFTFPPEKNETIRGIDFSDNKKISFLPFKVHKTFPTLMVIAASSCSIQEISRENFKNLKMLRGLWLRNNQIETIPSNSFQDLLFIDDIDLRNSLKNIRESSFSYILIHFRWQQNQADEWKSF